MEPITLAEINATKLINTNAKKWAKSNLNYLNKKGKLFGSSLKVEKGADKFETLILYLQPADKVATETLCSFAELAGCKAPCLISSGQLGMSTGQNAATKRTILMLLRPLNFNDDIKDIDLILDVQQYDKVKEILCKEFGQLYYKPSNANSSTQLLVDDLLLDIKFDVCFLPRKSLVLKYDIPYSKVVYKSKDLLLPNIDEETMIKSDCH